jgi:hypothetical protein
MNTEKYAQPTGNQELKLWTLLLPVRRPKNIGRKNTQSERSIAD